MHTLAQLIVIAACGFAQAASAAPSPEIVLSCSGQRISSEGNKTAAKYLIKVNPSDPLQDSLLFYIPSEKRFRSTCNMDFGDCELQVDADSIAESGVVRASNGRVMLQRLVEIDRRTGKMSISRGMFPSGSVQVFEGMCTKGELPPQLPQKF